MFWKPTPENTPETKNDAFRALSVTRSPDLGPVGGLGPSVGNLTSVNRGQRGYDHSDHDPHTLRQDWAVMTLPILLATPKALG